MIRRTIQNILLSSQLSNIAFLKSEKNLTFIHYFDHSTEYSSSNMKIFEKHLEPLKKFIRVHRSYIINSNYIIRIDKQAGFLKLKNNVVIPISKNFDMPIEIDIEQNNTEIINHINNKINMNFKIIVDEKKIANTILIGKTGLIRFKSSFSKLHNFDKSTRWLVGIDADEAGSYKHLFIIKAHKNSEVIGKKMICINNVWSLDVNHAIKEMKLKIPLTCDIEVFKDADLEGFKITL